MNHGKSSQKPSVQSGVAFLCACDGFAEVVVANENATMKKEVPS